MKGLPILSTPALIALGSVVALVLAMLVGRYARQIGIALELLDHPDGADGRKRHAGVIPLVGGIGVAGAAVAAATFGWLVWPDAEPAMHLGWLALTVASMFFIGMADDRSHLPPMLRLGAAMLILYLVVSDAPDFSLHFLRFTGQDNLLLLDGWLGIGFTLLCLVGLLNAVNMADGKNGIVIGLGLIWAAVLAVHAPLSVLPVLAAAGVALAVMWRFNMANRLFLGDGGSYAVSALFGLLAIYNYNHGFETLRADDVALLFAVPVFDTIRLMAARVLQGRSPFVGDRDHLHHHLHARIGWPRGLWVYLAMVAVPNIAALARPGFGLLWLALSLLAYVGVMLTTRFRAPAGRPAE